VTTWGTFYERINVDGFIESVESSFPVIPAKAGIQFFMDLQIAWTPVFTGVTAR